MKRPIAVFSTIAICLWILPLGAFIKPAQEKTACGGNRAFHMCTMGMSKAKKIPAPEKISFTNASGAEKTNKPAAGSGDNGFTSGPAVSKAADRVLRLAELDLIIPRKLFFSVPTPVPKA